MESHTFNKGLNIKIEAGKNIYNIMDENNSIKELLERITSKIHYLKQKNKVINNVVEFDKEFENIKKRLNNSLNTEDKMDIIGYLHNLESDIDTLKFSITNKISISIQCSEI